MARTGIQTEAIELLQFLDALQAVRIERALPLESVQDDAFQQIAERQIAVVGKGPQNLQNPLFHADTGLHALDNVFVIRYHGMNVPHQKKRSYAAPWIALSPMRQLGAVSCPRDSPKLTHGAIHTGGGFGLVRLAI